MRKIRQLLLLPMLLRLLLGAPVLLLRPSRALVLLLRLLARTARAPRLATAAMGDGEREAAASRIDGSWTSSSDVLVCCCLKLGLLLPLPPLGVLLLCAARSGAACCSGAGASPSVAPSSGLVVALLLAMKWTLLRLLLPMPMPACGGADSPRSRAMCSAFCSVMSALCRSARAENHASRALLVARSLASSASSPGASPCSRRHHRVSSSSLPKRSCDRHSAAESESE